MTALEIALLIGGAVIFVLSFIIPVNKQETSDDIKDMITDEVRSKVKGEIDDLRSHIDNVVDEAIEYAQEKTERSLERISNEKIMAVNEYSDTVLDEINKNHKEVMFLYDMLNNKHDDLISTVSEASAVAKTVKENAEAAAEAAEAAHESTKEAEAAVSSFKSLAPETVDVSPIGTKTEGNISDAVKQEKSPEGEPKVRTLKWAEFAIEQADEDLEQKGITLPDPSSLSDENKSEQTLQEQVIALHKLGQSDVEIARSLGMGVGEVSLIIGLHAGR